MKALSAGVFRIDPVTPARWIVFVHDGCVTIRKHVTVYGRVQGVGFRFAAVSEAERLGLAGWVRNCPDGTVEAEVEGGSEPVAAMIEWLGHGPRWASVTRVDVRDIAPRGDTGFTM